METNELRGQLKTLIIESLNLQGMTPDMIAETWLGAFACAEGNQMCSGNTPLFSPKPINASQNNDPKPTSSRIGPRSQLPVRVASIAKNANKQTVPAWEAAR